MKNCPYQTITLNNGMIMPILGFGTFLSKETQIGHAIKKAIDIGYRHIDCAVVYENQSDIGKALSEVFKEGKVKREDLFITSKLKSGGMEPSQIEAQLDETLKQLQLDYIDLYLIHQPIPTKYENDKNLPLRKMGWGIQNVWREMEKLNKKGKARAIGVSNVTAATLNDILCFAEIPPAINQIERHPFLPQNKLVKFCQKEGVQVTAYSPLGAPGLMSDMPSANLLKHDVINAIAKKHGKTSAQVLIRWSIDTGVVAIPKSVHDDRIKQNFDVFDFKLTESDLKEIEKLENWERSFDQEWCGVPIFF